MGTTTAIAWTDKTWSPWQGCTKVSPACDHCYAENIADTRFHVVKWGAGQPRKHTENWDSPRRWNKQAAREGRTIRVFPSMCDPFDNEVPAEWRVRFLKLIAETPHLTWLLLTKRIGNAQRMMTEAFRIGWPEHEPMWERWPELFRNVWLGATVCNQTEFDRDYHKLRDTPAAKRFLSIEPMLGAITAARGVHIAADEDGPNRIGYMIGADDGKSVLHISPEAALAKSGIDWVITGGESGHGARPSHPDWFRSLRDQCATAGVPFFFKQWGEYACVFDRDKDDPDWRRCDTTERKHPRGRWLNIEGGHGFHGERVVYMDKISTKKSGRHLDGREHLEFPT
jgi:protein gp37